MVAGDVRGPVVREFHVLGDAVNVAARLEAIAPPGDAPDAFAAAVGLRDLARAEILRHCGEPEAGSA